MLSAREAGDYVVIAPLGEQDLSNRAALEEQLRTLLSERRHVVVDLGDTSFVDVGFVRILADAAAYAAAEGIGFAVVMPSAPMTNPVMRMLLEHVPLGPNVRITRTLESAVVSVHHQRSELHALLAERLQVARRTAWTEAARTRRLTRERDLIVADLRAAMERCRQTVRKLDP
jgi:anti-anti-sigma regulatory factor